METLLQDIRYGLRLLTRRPGFTAVAVIALALGIGANSAIFSVVNGIILRPLPYRDPDRLAIVWSRRPLLQAQVGSAEFPVSAGDFVDWRDQNQVFEQIAAFHSQPFNLTGAGEPEYLGGVRASASLFSLLGVEPKLGRTFTPEEDQPGAERVVVISHGLWERRFGSDQHIIGQKLMLNDEPHTVGAVYPLPLSGAEEGMGFGIEGRPAAAPGETFNAGPRWVSADYFKVMGIPLIKGRELTERDGLDSPRALVISEAMARAYWPDEDPIGKRVAFDQTDGTPNWREIVGVVKDVKHSALDATAKPEMYVPFAQFPVFFQTVVLRTTGDPLSMVAAARSEVLAVNADQPISNVHTMEELLSNSIAQRRFNMLVLSIFAAVALLLSAVGIYGVVSYSVAQRTHELGVRMALGAQTSHVVALVVRQGMTPAMVGVGIGLAASFGLTRILASLLYGVSATDTLTFSSIALLLASVALLACYLPARRATKVDPMVALRYE